MLWRISRVLYKLSSEDTLPKQIRSEMLNDASKCVDAAMALREADANVHLWMAIIVDAKYGCEGTGQRVAHAHIVKRHLLVSICQAVCYFRDGCFILNELDPYQVQFLKQFSGFLKLFVITIKYTYNYERFLFREHLN